MITLTVIVIALLIAGLALYLYRVGTILTTIATSLEAADEAVAQVNRDAALIGPGVEHINRSGATVAGALPLLYGFAEQIVRKASPNPVRPEVAVPASGRRRSRLFDGVGLKSL